MSPSEPPSLREEIESDEGPWWIVPLLGIGYGLYKTLSLAGHGPSLQTLLHSPVDGLCAIGGIGIGLLALGLHPNRSILVNGPDRFLRVRATSLVAQREERIAFDDVRCVVLLVTFGGRYKTYQTSTLQFELKDGRNIPTARPNLGRDEGKRHAQTLARLIGCEVDWRSDRL